MLRRLALLPATSARLLDAPPTVEAMMLPAASSCCPAGCSCFFLDPSATEIYIVIMGSRVNKRNVHISVR